MPTQPPAPIPNTAHPVHYPMYSKAQIEQWKPSQLNHYHWMSILPLPVHAPSVSTNAHCRIAIVTKKRSRKVLKPTHSELEPPLKRAKLSTPPKPTRALPLMPIIFNAQWIPKPTRLHKDCAHVHKGSCHKCFAHLESDNSHHQICRHCVSDKQRMKFSRKPSINPCNIPRLRSHQPVKSPPIVLPINRRDNPKIWRTSSFRVGEAFARISDADPKYKAMQIPYKSEHDHEEYKRHRHEYQEQMNADYPINLRPKLSSNSVHLMNKAKISGSMYMSMHVQTSYKVELPEIENRSNVRYGVMGMYIQ
eukprot:128215_1